MAWRMIKWSVELSEFDLSYELKGPIKSHVLTDFIAELTPPDTSLTHDDKWILSVDDTTNLKGSNVGIILEGPDGVLIE